MSESLRDPQLEPSDHVYVVLQDFGPDGGGWGPAAYSVLGSDPRPVVYSGDSADAIVYLALIAEKLAQSTGKDTLLSCFTSRTDVWRSSDGVGAGVRGFDGGETREH